MSASRVSLPKFIILVGMPGSGKTTFAEKFSSSFGAPFVESKAIRTAINTEPVYTEDEQDAVNEITGIMVSQISKTKKTIVYEGPSESRQERKELIKNARSMGYDPIIIWFQTDPATCEIRSVYGVKGRENSHCIPESRFNWLVSRFTPPNDSEKPIVLSGKHTPAAQTKTIIKKLAHDYSNIIKSPNNDSLKDSPRIKKSIPINGIKKSVDI